MRRSGLVFLKDLIGYGKSPPFGAKPPVPSMNISWRISLSGPALVRGGITKFSSDLTRGGVFKAPPMGAKPPVPLMNISWRISLLGPSLVS